MEQDYERGIVRTISVVRCSPVVVQTLASGAPSSRSMVRCCGLAQGRLSSFNHFRYISYVENINYAQSS